MRVDLATAFCRAGVVPGDRSLPLPLACVGSSLSDVTAASKTVGPVETRQNESMLTIAAGTLTDEPWYAGRVDDCGTAPAAYWRAVAKIVYVSSA